MISTASATVDLPCISHPQSPSHRDTMVAPPRSSSLMATVGYPNLDSYAQKKVDPGFIKPTEALEKPQDKDSFSWSRLKREMGRQLFSRSISSISSSKPPLPIRETDSPKYSIGVTYGPSTAKGGTTYLPWENAEYTQQLSEAMASLQNDFVSGARQMADSALSTLSSLIVVAASTAESRDELWHMAVSAAKELCKARPSMNAAITSCLLRALEEVLQLWDMLDDKKNKMPEDLAAMARRQLVRILEKRKETGIRLSENFAERLRAYCRQVCLTKPCDL